MLLSNRAAARGLADRCMDALSDCERCVELAPTYWRGVKRRADCHAALGVWDKSIEDFQMVMKNCETEVKPASDAAGSEAPAPAVDEQTAKLLAQAAAGLKSVEKVSGAPISRQRTSADGASNDGFVYPPQLKQEGRPKDYYRILGTSKSTSETELRLAYRILSLRHHPDRGGRTALSDLVNEAYVVLGNRERRQQCASLRTATGAPLER